MASSEVDNNDQDPISRALSRAKSEHRSVAGGRPSSVRGWVQPTGQSASSVSAQQLTGERQITLDPEYLQAHHILAGPKLEDPIVSDQYRLLRTRVLQLMRGHGWHSVGITSPGTKAGKTLSSINLAISIAREGNHDVILLDADIRKPSIAASLGFEPEVGLVDYLTGACSLEQVMVSIADIPNLSILPGSQSHDSAAAPERLKSPRMDDLLDLVRRMPRRTVAIVDMPPVLLGDDVIAVAERIDAMLIVVDEGVTQVEELKEAARVLGDFNLMGTVLNKSRAKPKDFGGYYQAAAAARPQ